MHAAFTNDNNICWKWTDNVEVEQNNKTFFCDAPTVNKK